MGESIKSRENVPIHLILRFSDFGLEEGGTISNHRDILKNKGMVLVGKYGKPIGANMLRVLNEQISNKAETYMFLINSWPKSKKSIFVGIVTEISTDINNKDLSLVPIYYRRKASEIHSWVRVNRLLEVDKNILRSLSLVNTGNSANDALAHSMAGVFYVRFSKGETLANYIQ